MNQINIITAQNVTLKIELANIGDRFLAALIDMLIKIGIFLLAALVAALLQEAGAGKIITVTMWSLAVIFVVLYSLIFEYFTKGQTPGKRMFKVKVARLDGEQVSFGNLLLRWLFRIIDFPLAWPSIGISVISFTKKYQRIGDLVAGTIIVSTKERTSLQDTAYALVEEDYEPVFPQAKYLLNKDAEVIKKVINLYIEKDKYELVHIVAEKLKEVLEVHPNMDEVNFLRTVLKDYNFAESQTGKSGLL